MEHWLLLIFNNHRIAPMLTNLSSVKRLLSAPNIINYSPLHSLKCLSTFITETTWQDFTVFVKFHNEVEIIKNQ